MSDYDSYDGEYLPPKRKISVIIPKRRSRESDSDEPSPKRVKQLTPKEEKKYGSELKQIQKELEKSNYTVADIMRSNLITSEKLEMLELLDVIEMYADEPSMAYERLKIIRMIRDKLAMGSCFTPTDEKTARELIAFNNATIGVDTKILRCDHPIHVKAEMYKRYSEIKLLDKDNDHYVKTMQWIECVLKIPTNAKSVTDGHVSSAVLLSKLYEKLNQQFYGQHKAKERLLEIVSSLWVNPEIEQNVIVFAGAPGVGKTFYARLLGEVIGLPMYQLSLGGAKDPAWLKGHGFTYIGAQPGQIYNALAHMGCTNGILILDELDKISYEVSCALLHILDKTQNKEFKDDYINIPIDLSKLLIIVAVNDVNEIDPTLRNRLQIVQFEPYNTEDKVSIGYNYLLPRLLSSFKLTDVVFTRKHIEQIVELSVDEKGVRQLERNLMQLIERVNILKQLHLSKSNLKLSYSIPNFKLPFKPTSEHIVVLCNN